MRNPSATSRRTRLLALVSLLLVSCRSSRETQAPVLGEIPVPPWIHDSDFFELADGRLQRSFVAIESYPSSRVRDFYAQWAAENHWQKVPPEIESWSHDSWESSLSTDGTAVDQWLVHWHSADKSKSLRLALRHHGDRAAQQVFVLLSPYFPPEPEGEPKTLGDYIDAWEKGKTQP